VVSRPDDDIWIAILALRRHASGRDTTSSGRLIDLSFIETWKESETGRVLRGVQTCCRNVRTDGSWIEPSRHSGGSGWKCTSSGWMMLGLTDVQTVWHVVRMDGTVVRWASGWRQPWTVRSFWTLMGVRTNVADWWASGWNTTSSWRLIGNRNKSLKNSQKLLKEHSWRVDSG